MSEVEQAVAPAPEAPAAEAPESFSTASEAAAFLARHAAAKRRSSEAPVSGEAPAEATAEESAPEAEDAAPQLEAPGDETEQAEPAQPPIEPPRSWTKEEKEEFATYPREAQEKIARREQERESALRRGQNEAAEKLKGLTAKEQAAEQARQQYEQALPALLQTLNDRMQGEFSDVKTLADVQKLAAEDPFRFAQFQAKQMEIAGVQQELQRANDRQRADYQQKWTEFSSKEDQAFADRVPEMSDPAKAKLIAESAVNVLHDIGFTDQELAKLWNGEASVSLRDHRLQLLIRDAVKLKDAQKAAFKPAAKPVPPVQKPGNAVRSPNRAVESQIAALEAKPSLSLKEATQLVQLKGARGRAA